MHRNYSGCVGCKLHLLKSTQIILSTQQLLAVVAATHSPTRLNYGVSVNGQWDK